LLFIFVFFLLLIVIHILPRHSFCRITTLCVLLSAPIDLPFQHTYSTYTYNKNDPDITMSRDKVLTAAAVERMIADDQTIVIYEDSILKLDGWMDRHPGGRLAVLHMVGRDATDEMKA